MHSNFPDYIPSSRVATVLALLSWIFIECLSELAKQLFFVLNDLAFVAIGVLLKLEEEERKGGDSIRHLHCCWQKSNLFLYEKFTYFIVWSLTE